MSNICERALKRFFDPSIGRRCCRAIAGEMSIPVAVARESRQEKVAYTATSHGDLRKRAGTPLSNRLQTAHVGCPANLSGSELLCKFYCVIQNELSLFSRNKRNNAIQNELCKNLGSIR